MATNSSEHLGLHLWEPTDQVLRTEFNQNWSTLDEAVNTAQETADTAESKADAAQTAASTAYTPSNKPYVVGNYTGDGGSAIRHFSLGFKPSLLIIGGQNGSYTEGEETLYRLAIIGGSWSRTAGVFYTIR